MSDETAPQVPQPDSDESPDTNIPAADVPADAPTEVSASETSLAASEATPEKAPAPVAAIASHTTPQSRWQQAKTWGKGLLALVRSRLPAAWQPRLSDGVLSAILLGLGAFIVILVASLPSPPAAVSTSQPLVKLPSPVTEVVEAPKATLELPPEQDLITQIQDQVAGMSEQYTAGLVQSVQADFRRSELTVNLGSQWYQLSRDRQDQVANGILEAVQPLAFERLRLIDEGDQLLARSPVVGTQMVILQRQAQSLVPEKVSAGG
ncbi:hypothetical protein [Almyronema epifaneia]|uniref:Uncharacterized protein n=1 Tax=Almyronema epifaneia S1 TaxID=2991925 RepID=A0ABW6IKB2_9CYAN